MRQKDIETKNLRAKMAVGYILILLLVGGIVHTWHGFLAITYRNHDHAIIQTTDFLCLIAPEYEKKHTFAKAEQKRNGICQKKKCNHTA